MNDPITFVESLARPRVALLGEFMLDRYVYGDCDEVSPEAPVPVLRVVRRESRPGGAAFVAAGMLALGSGVRCLGAVGEDEPAEELLAQLSAAGAEVDWLSPIPGRPTTTRQRLIGLAQHRHQQQVLRVDEGSSLALTPEALTGLRAGVERGLESCRVLAIQDYGAGRLCGAVGPEVIAAARARGVPVVVDPSAVTDYGCYRGATLVLPNRQEAQKASGVTIADDASAERAAEGILQASQAEGVAITLDKDGAYLKRRGEAGRHVPTQPRQVYDVSGAGDVVLATVCVALAGGADWDLAVTLANVAGGLEVERFGIVPIKRGELLAELIRLKRQHHGKVVAKPELLMELQSLRSAGKTIVWTNGCFDILHAGHVGYLNFARRQGDVLVVGVNSDASVKMNKGPTRPIVGQEDRAEVLAGLECVDYVVVFDDQTPIELIRQVRPDVLVKGSQWQGAVVGQDVVEANGGKVVLAPMRPERSTTGIINKITATHGTENP